MVSSLAKKVCGSGAEGAVRGDPCTDCAINLLLLLKPAAVLNLHNPPEKTKKKKNPKRTTTNQKRSKANLIEPQPRWQHGPHLWGQLCVVVAAVVVAAVVVSAVVAVAYFVLFAFHAHARHFFRLLKVFFDFVF